MRPLPIYPRGPRRIAPRPPTLLLGCPRICPDWEYAALRALIKPQTKGAILHRPALQKWPARGAAVVADCRALVVARLGVDLPVETVDRGDYWLAGQIHAEQEPFARALAVLLSRRLGPLWLVLGGLFVREGRFFRRQRGYKFHLKAARDVHLRREVRAALGDVLGGDPH
jgi:hypothetical protein